MKLYKFTNGRKVALTKDEQGSNLPQADGPWKRIGSINVQSGQGARIGASSDDIINAINKDGFVIWPVPKM